MYFSLIGGFYDNPRNIIQISTLNKLCCFRIQSFILDVACMDSGMPFSVYLRRQLDKISWINF